MAGALKKDDLYSRDFYAWTQDQAAKLRARAGFDNRGDIDWENAAEEIESVGASEKREIRSRLIVLILSRLIVLILHILKWRFQPKKRKQGWRLTIDEQRDRIAMAIEDSPSLRDFPASALAASYRSALRKAIEETGLPEKTFPPECPFTIDEILDPGFYPGEG